jgi:hypothetical protein
VQLHAQQTIATLSISILLNVHNKNTNILKGVLFRRLEDVYIGSCLHQLKLSARELKQVGLERTLYQRRQFKTQNEIWGIEEYHPNRIHELFLWNILHGNRNSNRENSKNGTEMGHNIRRKKRIQIKPTAMCGIVYHITVVYGMPSPTWL